jgi:hypothetical protein
MVHVADLANLSIRPTICAPLQNDEFGERRMDRVVAGEWE